MMTLTVEASKGLMIHLAADFLWPHRTAMCGQVVPAVRAVHWIEKAQATCRVCLAILRDRDAAGREELEAALEIYD